MDVELTPKGTYGAGLPKIPRPLIKAAIWLSVVAFRLFGQRMRVMGRPLLLLTTVGARSGQHRRTPLCWFPDGDAAWLIVASGAGSPKHPAWYFNMAKNPDQVWIEVDGRKLKVQPRSLKDRERQEAWQRIVALSPGFGTYQQKTDRQIPVIRLQPEN
jgi:deazaflavin-dependent oxidoreductase (nitroreductase family)